MKYIVPGVFFILSTFIVYSQPSEVMDEAQTLYFKENHEEVLKLLKHELEDTETDSTEAAYYWRMARSRFNKTDLALFEGLDENTAIEQLEKGKQYAEEAIARYEEERVFDREALSRAVFWKAAHMGKISQLHGVLNSLFKADDIRDLLARSIRLDPEFPSSYYVLGQLYEQLPGSPLSFGDSDKAVNVGRKSVHLHEDDIEAGIVPYPYLDFYLELARHLWKRNWDIEKRNEKRREKIGRLDSVTKPLEKAHNFEGSIEILNISDRKEAREILENTLRRLETAPIPELRRAKVREKAVELRNAWGV